VNLRRLSLGRTTIMKIETFIEEMMMKMRVVQRLRASTSLCGKMKKRKEGRSLIKRRRT
jgi:hypothetical protein